MGLFWAVGWAVAGILIGVGSRLLPGLPWWDPFFEVFDAPLPAMAIPGFFAGALFSIVLGIAARRRRFDELSLPGFTAWGALGGLLLLALPFALVAVGLASREGSDIGAAQILAAIGGPFVVLSALSAAVTLTLARRAEDRQRLEPGDEDAELTRGEVDVGQLPSGADVSLPPRPATRPERKPAAADRRTR